MANFSVPNEEPKGPGINVFPQSITTHEGSKVTFNLETIRNATSGLNYIRFDPKLTFLTLDLNELSVEWSKDSKPIEESNASQTKIDENKYCLTIPSVRLADMGQYTASAKDATGITSVTFSLNVITEADL